MKRSAKATIAGTIVFLAGLVFGIGGIVHMLQSFNSPGGSNSVSAQELAESVTTSFISTAIGVPLAIIGLCLGIGGLIFYLKRRDKTTNGEQHGETSTGSGA